MTVLVQAAAEPSCYSFELNHWVCASYFEDQRDKLVSATTQHLAITVAAVCLGLVVALPLAVLARQSRILENWILGLSTAFYTIPSLALFPLLAPFTGITATTVVIGLGLYSLTILVRNTLAGLRSVPDEVRESAAGNGYGPVRMLLTIELPLALPVVMAGLRVATVSTVALTTVGTLVSYGGLGNLLADGVRNDFKAEIFAASVLCVLLALILDVLLLLLQRLLTPWARAGA